jgi:hypothetical protein
VTNSFAIAGSGTLFEDERLRVRFIKGESNEAVISFSGVGTGDYRIRDMNKPSGTSDGQNATQIDEFRKTLGGTKNVYYVADKQRGWYNGLENRILDLINTHLAEHETKRVLALGYSMGGSAALMFASRIQGCRQALAFAPQSSVHPDLVPFEDRWGEYRANITEWTTPDPIQCMEDGKRRYYVIYGMDEDRDEKHIQRILSRELPNVIVFGIHNCGHDVAPYLKNNGVSLTDIVDKAYSGSPHDVRAVIKTLPYSLQRAGFTSDADRARRKRSRA